MLKPARPYYNLWNDDQRPLSFDFPLSRRGNLELQKKFWFNP